MPQIESWISFIGLNIILCHFNKKNNNYRNVISESKLVTKSVYLCQKTSKSDVYLF